MARLVGESGSVAGKEWPIEVGVTIGREAHNTIAMPDNKKCSRDHCKVWKESVGRYSIADLGSTNGTLVNDDRVSRQPLVDGDEIRIGEAVLRFLLDEDEKPKKKEAPQRMAELLRGGAGAATGEAEGGPAARGAPGAGPAGSAMPTIEVKQRVLQYQKKSAGGSVAGWDLAQASSGTRWLMILVAAAVGTGLFLLVKSMIAGS